eukprot:CAMPEP_0177422826 /NCGR_PEP_ID=MMETSP0368-20130122/71556_1 /TAXON_ID=447022 ORGANISM="Scrippsiella hangoei-like, Strain SHHI-4" /NCGR_SAMPLE_ID=MMETSP0368 /ASSEMBLY_ACC=CAM_ASM_000363 /LENGTH=134 /DNA_ID=CAMNT_0018892831 /DNA_START=81 /DNA_END=485 /DNA_ORIENTATION=-
MTLCVQVLPPSRDCAELRFDFLPVAKPRCDASIRELVCQSPRVRAICGEALLLHVGGCVPGSFDLVLLRNLNWQLSLIQEVLLLQRGRQARPSSTSARPRRQDVELDEQGRRVAVGAACGEQSLKHTWGVYPGA